jgi:hypothetical protein
MLPRFADAVGTIDLIDYSFQAGITFASLLRSAISQKLHKSVLR